MVVQSNDVTDDLADGYFDRLDQVGGRKPLPVTRPKDTVGQLWACRRLMSYLERRVKTVKELMDGVDMVAALFCGWERDGFVQSVLEAAEDGDVAVRVIRGAA